MRNRKKDISETLEYQIRDLRSDITSVSQSVLGNGQTVAYAIDCLCSEISRNEGNRTGTRLSMFANGEFAEPKAILREFVGSTLSSYNFGITSYGGGDFVIKADWVRDRLVLMPVLNGYTGRSIVIHLFERDFGGQDE